MPSIHVCSWSRLDETVAASSASHVVTLINEGTPVLRPAAIPADRHLFLGFNDVTAPGEGLVPPGIGHLERLIGFLTDWDRARPAVIHCFAGISRSTAGAFVALCALAPGRDEREIAWRLRGASRSATPNPLMVSLADGLLGRNGRMVEAIAAIGRGRDAYEGEPFALQVAG